MEELRLGVIESQFAEIIWSNEPLPSGELVKLCEQKLGWKKSTTYTVLKRLRLRVKAFRGIITSLYDSSFRKLRLAYGTFISRLELRPLTSTPP